ncbi:MAG: pyridine nucleotide transhydrogenase, partial [Janthinobacterium lividum]
RSTNIDDIRGKSFDTIVCAGAPAQKWIANQDPKADRKKIDHLIGCLSAVTCRSFILISTVDVFKDPIDVTEDSPVDEAGLHAYGKNRRLLEKFVAEKFEHHLIVRLPGLVGPGLRKNVIYDFLNQNNLHAVESRGTFQFYPMVNLWFDIQTALDADLRLVHLTAEPVAVSDISLQGFGAAFENHVSAHPARYDMRTKHGAVYAQQGRHYMYTVRETIQAVRAFAQSEPPASKAVAGESA